MVPFAIPVSSYCFLQNILIHLQIQARLLPQMIFPTYLPLGLSFVENLVWTIEHPQAQQEWDYLRQNELP